MEINPRSEAAKGLGFKFYPIKYEQEMRPSTEQVRELRMQRDMDKLRQESMDHFLKSLLLREKEEFQAYSRLAGDEILGMPVDDIGRAWSCDSCLDPLAYASTLVQPRILVPSTAQHLKCSCLGGPMLASAKSHLSDMLSLMKQDTKNRKNISKEAPLGRFYEDVLQSISQQPAIPSGTWSVSTDTLTATSKAGIWTAVKDHFDRSLTAFSLTKLQCETSPSLESLERLYYQKYSVASELLYGVFRSLLLRTLSQSLECILWDSTEMRLLYETFRCLQLAREPSTVATGRAIQEYSSSTVVVYLLSVDSLLAEGTSRVSDETSVIGCHLVETFALHLAAQGFPPVVAVLPDTKQYRSCEWTMECLFDPFTSQHSSHELDENLVDLWFLNIIGEVVLGRHRHLLLLVDSSSSQSECQSGAVKTVQMLWHMFHVHEIRDVLFLPVTMSPELLPLHGCHNNSAGMKSRVRFCLLRPFMMSDYATQLNDVQLSYESEGAVSEEEACDKLWQHMIQALMYCVPLQATHLVAFHTLYWTPNGPHMTTEGCHSLTEACEELRAVVEKETVFQCGKSVVNVAYVSRALSLLGLSTEEATQLDSLSPWQWQQLKHLSAPLHRRLHLLAAVAVSFCLSTGALQNVPYLQSLLVSSASRLKEVHPGDQALLRVSSSKLTLPERQWRKSVQPLVARLVQVLSTACGGDSRKWALGPVCHKVHGMSSGGNRFDAGLVWSLAQPLWEAFFPSCSTNECGGPSSMGVLGRRHRGPYSGYLAITEQQVLCVNLQNPLQMHLLQCLLQVHGPQLEAYLLLLDWVLMQVQGAPQESQMHLDVDGMRGHLQHLCQEGLSQYGRLTTDERWLQGFLCLLLQEGTLVEGEAVSGLGYILHLNCEAQLLRLRKELVLFSGG